MEYVKLNNGVEMPILGFGVYQIPASDTKRCVLDAIKVGFRAIDTAQSYFNESEVGDAIVECGLPREELFITTKIWIDNYGYENCKQSVMESLKKLKTDYIDLVLLHQPFADYYGAYKALEELYEEGKIRAIGVSNFYPDRLADICLFERKVIPAINQIEVNPLNAQFKAQENMEKYGVHMEAWAPFGEGRNGLFTNEVLVNIGKKYNKSSAQVILRWLIQRGVIIACKSTHIERMQENFNVFDFELNDDDMKAIANLNTSDSLFFNHQDPKMVEWFNNIVKERRTNKVIIIASLGVGSYYLINNKNIKQNKSNTETGNTTDNNIINNEENNTSIDTDKKILVVYYSATGSTEEVAKEISNNLNADIFEIEPKELYTSEDLNWNNSNSRVSREHNDESLRNVELKTTKVDNWDDYDTVLIGYPIWWGIAAWPVNNFIKENDFTGKNVIPFCTSASSGIGQSGNLLENMSTGGNWQEGHRFSSGASKEDIKSWTDSLK